MEPVPESKPTMTLAPTFPALLTRAEYQAQAKALKASPSLSQMVCIVLQMGLFVARCLLEDELQRRAQEPVKWSTCCACGDRLHSKGWQKRQMQTLVGEIH